MNIILSIIWYKLFEKNYKRNKKLLSNVTVDLFTEDNKIIIGINDNLINNNHLIEIKHRDSGNFIEKTIDSNNIIFQIDELLKLADSGYFDINIKNKNGINERIKFKSSNESFNVLCGDNKFFTSFSTMYNNLTLILKKIKFNYVISNIVLKDNNINIVGEITSNTDFDISSFSNDYYIEIKHRKNGKRIVEKIEHGKVTFLVDELFNLETVKTFDLYFNVRTDNDYLKRRIKYNPKLQFFKIASKKHNCVLKATSTKMGNLSFISDVCEFTTNINEFKLNNSDELKIKGNLTILNSEISHVNKVTIFSQNRETNEKYENDISFVQIDEDSYEFEGIINIIPINSEITNNLRLDYSLRIYEDEIYFQELIDFNNFKNYSFDENRFLLELSSQNHIFSYYATAKFHSLALWITTNESWDKSYEIAKGRSIYDKYYNQKMDSNIVFFESFFGKSYSGNPKYIYETMLELGLNEKYTFVWAYSGENKDIIPGNPIIVERYKAGDYYKYLALAKYWVNNIIFPIHKKRSGNIYLQTWHGTPLKKLGFDITIPGPEVDARDNFYQESRNWDYLLSSNQYSSEIFKRAFKYNDEIVECGYPINDIFFKDNSKLINDIKNNLNIPLDKKIILYAPTWKDDEKNDNWDHYFNLEIDLKRLYDEFHDEYVILLKMHHLVSENINITNDLDGFAFDVSDYDDIQELYIMSDVLITDYSSVFFDFAHSKRPILFFTPDLDHYVENVRGLYLNMKKDLPGPIIENNDELIYNLKNIDEVYCEYKDKYDEFYNIFCSLCTGESGRRIVEKIFKG